MKRILSITIAFLLIFSMTLISCEDNPASSNDNDSDHAPAIGFKLLIDDDILLRYFQREYTFDPDNNFPQYVQGDSALVFRSEDVSNNITDEIQIRWIDQNETVFDLAEFGEDSGGTAGDPGDYHLNFRYFEPGTTSSIPDGDRTIRALYDMDEETWKFAFELLQEGRTDIRINLFHIDHDDLVPRTLPIYVEM